MSEKKNENGYKGRFREIAAVLHKHEISKGITPEKLRLILEDLGPTFVKVGQLMSLRSDILPKNYCDELQKLCSDVPPMPFYEVEEVLGTLLDMSGKKNLSGSMRHRLVQRLSRRCIGHG